MKLVKSNLGLHIGLLLFICLGIFVQNFPFESWYTGWDNLHPEFDFYLNFKRALTSVWQENQGLGTYGGHGYAATLPHTFIIWIFSLFLPLQYLRSFFTFTMLFTGAFGIFFLSRHLLKQKSESVKNSASLISSTFYMLNLATVQQFYIQLEAFTVHYATLPWLFFTLALYLNRYGNSKKYLILFTSVSIFATIQGFIPPLFLVYFLMLCVFLVCYLCFKPSIAKLKKTALIFLLTLTINAYWLAPVAYYTTTQSTTYLKSYNNISSTENFILKNKKYGNLANISLLKGFIFEAVDSSDNGELLYIFQPWSDHINFLPIRYTGYLLFIIMLIGLVTLTKPNRNYFTSATLINFLFIFSLLASDTPPFSFISQFLQENPVTKQAFRVGFTKFSLALAYLYSLGLGVGVAILLQRIHAYTRQRGQNLFIFFVMLMLVAFSWPVFTGNLLYKRTKLDIPKSYFELFRFFKTQDNKGRIANLPQGWNWGWSIYRWGYSGSGFIWYGIEQPILDRAFDVWGKYNENYFWEIHHAIYSEKFFLIDLLVEKYNISWIVLDKNILPYANPRGHLYTDEVEEHLNSSAKYQKIKSFASKEPKVKEIMVYEVKKENNYQHLQTQAYNAKEFKKISPISNLVYQDKAYTEPGNYYNNEFDSDWEIYYPFTNVFSARKVNRTEVDIQEYKDRFVFTVPIPKHADMITLQTPHKDQFFTHNFLFDPAKNQLSLSINKSSELESYTSDNDPYFLNHKPQNCSFTTNGGTLNQEATDQDTLQFSSLDSENCYTIALDTIEHRHGYLLTIESKNIKGKPLEFSLVNRESRKSDITVELSKKDVFIKDFVMIPAMKFDGVGYGLLFNNISIGNEETINELKSVRLYPVPFNLLTGTNLTNEQADKKENQKLVVFSQSYDKGWTAYKIPNHKLQIPKIFSPLLGQKIENHVLVNNWANGWILPDEAQNSTIVLVYLPQYLEYAGFVLLFATLVFIIFQKNGYWRS